MGKRGNKCKNKEIKFKMLSGPSPDPALLQIAGQLGHLLMQMTWDNK